MKSVAKLFWFQFIVIAAVVILIAETAFASPFLVPRSHSKSGHAASEEVGKQRQRLFSGFFTSFLQCPPIQSSTPGVKWTSLWCLMTDSGSESTSTPRSDGQTTASGPSSEVPNSSSPSNSNSDTSEDPDTQKKA